MPPSETPSPSGVAAEPQRALDLVYSLTYDLDRQRDDLWARIRSGFALRDFDHRLVEENEAWYAARPDYFRRMIDRSKRYLYYIVEEVERRGMPTEIALLPMIESAYNPVAYSRSHASGIWQFIPSTGKVYGLKQNWWYDGRRDVIAATDAALDYLQNLYAMFGDWELALAAYNWGEGAVSRALLKNQARGLPLDFQSLTVPPETRNYVPKLIAVKNIIGNPARYGLELESVPDRPYFRTVTLTRHIDVKLAAQLAEIPLDEFVALNPGHSRPVIPAKAAETLLLPEDKADVFLANLESHDAPLTSWQTYTLKPGDKLDRVAPRFGISLAHLKQVNGITPRTRVASGHTLLVPARKPVEQENLTEGRFLDVVPPLFGRRVVHTVRKGETAATVARRYGVTLAQLKAWNGAKVQRLATGERLVIERKAGPAKPTRVAAAPTKASKSAAEPKRTHYTVRKGDTFSSIARRFKVAIADLQRWNSLLGNILKPGARVTVYLARNG
ncbi:MAG: LysM peptidoglycan-binding domain-containing protein [Betaproteobacteria bacterium]|nr:LysM peptidoglycan-binding domain-containing protein [Betaproteobacteria bacterium]